MAKSVRFSYIVISHDPDPNDPPKQFWTCDEIDQMRFNRDFNDMPEPHDDTTIENTLKNASYRMSIDEAMASWRQPRTDQIQKSEEPLDWSMTDEEIEEKYPQLFAKTEETARR